MNQEELRKRLNNLETVSGVNSLLKEVSKLNVAGRNIILQALSENMTEQKKQKFVALLRSEAVKTDKAIKQWVETGLTRSYIQGLNQAELLIEKPLKAKTFTLPVTTTYYKGKITLEILKTSAELRPHLVAVNNLLQDAYLDFGNSMTGFIRGAERVLNEQIKRQVRSELAIGRLEGKSIRDVKKTVTELFKEKGFTVLLDKGGRQWELERYSELIARTHIIKANNEAVINRATDFKIDVVEISSHGTKDDLCASQEGKLYSVSGEHDEYEKLDGNEPPYHPNCKHTLLLRPDK